MVCEWRSSTESSSPKASSHDGCYLIMRNKKSRRKTKNIFSSRYLPELLTIDDREQPLWSSEVVDRPSERCVRVPDKATSIARRRSSAPSP